MAYHAAGFMTPEFVRKFRNTFIIREPRYVLASLYEMWPDFTFEEAGYEDLYRLFGYATEEGQEPIVVVASDLSENLESVVAAYCKKPSILHKPEGPSPGSHTRSRSGKYGKADTTMPSRARG